MLTYHGNPDLKCALIRRAELHREADRLRQDYGYFRAIEEWGGRRHHGCAIGCLATPAGVRRKIDQQEAVEALGAAFGLTPVLVRTAEALFETLPKGAAQDWPEAFAHAVPVGIEITDQGVRTWGRDVPSCSPSASSACLYPDTENEVVVLAMRDALCEWLRSLAPDQPAPTCEPVMEKVAA